MRRGKRERKEREVHATLTLGAESDKREQKRKRKIENNRKNNEQSENND
jgi:hypothetical protein